MSFVRTETKTIVVKTVALQTAKQYQPCLANVRFRHIKGGNVQLSIIEQWFDLKGLKELVADLQEAIEVLEEGTKS